jgi:lipopolysaccharide/colanic/teichoic acid biosynthesis glycosyltransferase
MKTMQRTEAPKTSTAHYRHITVHASATQVRRQQNLFYIGENISLVANLAKAFHMGYASSVNLRQAIAYLRELQKEECSLRGFLIDVPMHQLHLQNFLQYISGTPYANLPVLYVSTHLTQAETISLTSGHVVDDVVHPIRDIFTIGDRIVFLGKVKEERIARNKRKGGWAEAARLRSAAMAKRLADIFFSSLMILLTAPLMLLIALLVKLDSHGPVFHNTYRAGRGYRVFKLYRFRTGKVGAARLVTSLSQLNLFRDNDAKFIKACHETGLTRIGRILRCSSLEALPQLFNVLKGDMSVVGNRPLPLNEASSLTSDEFAERFNAPAGITGLWQVASPELKEGSALRYDLEYARTASLALDMQILWRTPRTIWEKMKDYRKGL